MDYRKLIFATLAGGVVMWLAGGIWHELIAATLYAGEEGNPHDGIAIILVGYLTGAAIMAYIYPLGYKGGRPIIEGLKFGILMGILWVFPHDLSLAGSSDISMAYIFKNTAWHIVEKSIGGIVIALIYGKMAS